MAKRGKRNCKVTARAKLDLKQLNNPSSWKVHLQRFNSKQRATTQEDSDGQRCEENRCNQSVPDVDEDLSTEIGEALQFDQNIKNCDLRSEKVIVLQNIDLSGAFKIELDNYDNKNKAIDYEKHSGTDPNQSILTSRYQGDGTKNQMVIKKVEFEPEVPLNSEIVEDYIVSNDGVLHVITDIDACIPKVSVVGVEFQGDSTIHNNADIPESGEHLYYMTQQGAAEHAPVTLSENASIKRKQARKNLFREPTEDTNSDKRSSEKSKKAYTLKTLKPVSEHSIPELDDTLQSVDVHNMFEENDKDSLQNQRNDDEKQKKEKTKTKKNVSKTKRMQDSNDSVGCITIRPESKVTLELKRKLHSGTYTVNLFTSTQNRDSILLGFLTAHLPDRNHQCVTLMESEQLTDLIVEREKNGKIANMVVEMCIPIGVYYGKEMFVSTAGRYITPIRISRAAMRVGNIRKQHCCLYCHISIAEISRHLTTLHANETQVENLLKFPANSKERNEVLKNLRIQGDALYNREVADSEKIPLRCFDTENTASVNCTSCGGLVAERGYARHQRKCTGRPANRKQVLKEARATSIDQPNFVQNQKELKQKLLFKLMDSISSDDIGHVIRSDYCISKVALKYAFMHRENEAALKNDRQHLRRAARLLIEVRNLDPSIIDYEDLFMSSNYNILIEAVYLICAYNNRSNAFGKGPLALVLRSVITILIDELMNSYLRDKQLSKDSEAYKNADRFMTLHMKNYAAYVGRSAGRSRIINKMREQKPNPKPADVKLFTNYINNVAKENFSKLQKEGFRYDFWLGLGKALLAKIILFNRRRVNEVSKMLIEFFAKREQLSTEQMKSLSVLEQALASNFMRMKLLAKRDHILHVLLDEETCRGLELFLEFRGAAGVPKDNPYIFGVPTKAAYIDASVVLREMSTLCGADEPATLRATYLRKQVATLSQMLSMDDNQIHQIATYMGHTDEVHRRVYRQDEQLFQLTAWAKFLTLVSNDNIGQFRGKSFEEIIQSVQDPGINPDDIEEQPTEQYGTEDTEEAEPTEEEIRRIARIEEGITSRPHLLRDQENANKFDTNQQESVASTEYAMSEEEEQLSTPKKRKRSSSIDRASDTECPETSKGDSTKCAYPRSDGRANKQEQKKKNLSGNNVEETTPRKKSGGYSLWNVYNSPPKKKRTRVNCSKQEEKLILKYFHHYVSSNKLPTLSKCEEFLDEHHTQLHPGRTVRHIYSFVQYRRNKKRDAKKAGKLLLH